jgi:hypothetical protein
MDGFAVPVLVIGAVTPKVLMAGLLTAFVICPWLLIVSVGFAYTPAVAPVGARAIVPVVLMNPPERPDPTVIPVTVPFVVEQMVTAPVLAERLIPEPASKLVTPVLHTVTLPVVLLTAMAVPALTLVTAPPPPPVEQMYAVALFTQSPVPTIRGRYGPQRYHCNGDWKGLFGMGSE